MNKILHPAKYSDSLLPIFKKFLEGKKMVLDPFAGTGKIKLVCPTAVLLEIEPEWAAISGAIVGDALCMPFKNNVFDAICTSPTYGNRMADHFIDGKPEKKYKRNTYTHCLGRKLSDNNTGAMNWGGKYRDMHEIAWSECARVLKPNGIFILNISDHIRKGAIIPVTEWHISTIIKMGFKMLEHIKISTPRNRFGANSKIRVGYESIIVFEKHGTDWHRAICHCGHNDCPVCGAKGRKS